MKNSDTKEKFIELRAKGWSVNRIARELKASKPILIGWAVTGQKSTGSL
jgi:hypothetical protein